MTRLADTKKSFENGVQIAWDSTSLETAQTCLRKYYYALILGIKPKSKSVHLIFGGEYAYALESFYRKRAEGMSIDEALHEVVAAALTRTWSRETGLPVEFNDVSKTRVNLIRSIVWYIEEFAEESEDGICTYHLANGDPAVELSFTLEAADNILLCGHLDRVVKFGDSLYVMDQKTTGSTPGPYYFETFRLSNQMSLYAWAGRAILHSPVSGVIIDAAQVAVNFTRFERGITTRSAAQLDEWFESATHTIMQAQEAARRDYWPQNFTSCQKYSGCEFRELCGRSPQVRANYIKSDYLPHNWDPIVPRHDGWDE